MSTGKTVLVVAGVAVGAYVVLELVRTLATKSTAPATRQSSDGTVISSALNFAANVLRQPSPTNGPNVYGPPPVYVIGEGYTQGGGNAPIDPSTGAVYLPPGESFGPLRPT